jgi:hypothetical protein
MFLAGVIFLSGVSISLVAAYFSIIGLATMFPGSKEAIIIMGGVLEVGKLVAAVWLHKNWDNSFKFLRFYLLSAVIVLSAITSMGIFGFLSKSHVEHGASMEKEQATILQLENKIERRNEFITQRESFISKIESRVDVDDGNKDEVIQRLQERVSEIKSESDSIIKAENELIKNYNSRISELDVQLNSAGGGGLFSNKPKYNELVESQSTERESISQSKKSSLDIIKSSRESSASSISSIRSQIDSIQLGTPSSLEEDPKVTQYRSDIELAYEEISAMENEKFDYGSALRTLETEIGPIKYVVGALQEWIGLSVGIEQAIRIIIVILIFVFDPLAILLLISGTITYSKLKEDDLPPDVKEIRNKLIDELEEYLNDGGIAEHFIDRAKK